jgi:DNA-binding protein H-NS
MSMNISGLPLADLRSLQEQIKQEIKKREHEDVAKAREQIMAIAHGLGIPLKDIMGTQVRAKGATVAVRYRHPSDSSLQWTGRGRQPKWIKDWLALDLSLDALRVK